MSDSEGKESTPLEDIVIEDEDKPRNKRRRKPKTKLSVEEIRNDENHPDESDLKSRRKKKKKKSKEKIINYGETYLCLENFLSKKKDSKELKGMKKVTKKFYNKQNDIISTFESLLSPTEDSSKEEGMHTLCVYQNS